MGLLKKAVTVKGNAIFDVETLFSRLLVMGQQCSSDIADVFQFELSPVPPSLVEEYGNLRKGYKAVLVKSLSVSVTTPCAPDVVLVDASQFLYHIVWPVSGTTGDLAPSFGTRLTHVSRKIVLFDRYDQEAPNAKDHERTRRGRSKEVHLSPNTPPLPSFHYEKLFFTIPRTRICLTTFYATILFHTTSNSSTYWTVSLPMMRQTLSSAATVHRQSESSVMIPTSSFS